MIATIVKKNTKTINDKKIIAQPLDLNHEAECFYRREVGKLGFGKRFQDASFSTSKFDEPLVSYLQHGYFKSGAGLYICGESASGKTSTLAYIAYSIIKSFGIAGVAGQPELIDCWSSPSRGQIMFLSRGTMADVLDQNATTESIRALKEIAGVQYLLIDDIDGAGLPNHALYRLQNIIERRYQDCLTTIVTGSSSLADLQNIPEYISIAHKLTVMCQVVELPKAETQICLA